MRSRTIAAALLTVGTLAGSASADAHVSLHPNTIPAGAFATLDVRVPGEQQGAYAYKVDMLVPPGFTEIDTQNVAGWSVREVLVKPAQPIQTEEGPVDEEVSRLVWTGDRSKLGRIENATFIQFPLSIAMPADLAGRSLAFRTVEYYRAGKAVHWSGSPSAEFPAPTINVTAKGGVIEDLAGGEAGPAPGQAPAGSALRRQGATGQSATATLVPTGATSSTGASEDLAITALVLGVLGLLAGVGALVAVRRARSSA
jgi:uncharacterized protein YcnI